MAYEQRDNSGTLGKNDRKEKETHPDHRGACVIGGVHYWISAWIKTNASEGNKFFSLSFTEKDQQPGGKPTSAGPSRSSAPSPDNFEFDDDIPF